MDASELARVRFFTREDAWEAWLLLVPVEADQKAMLNLALTVEGSAQGVAAYLLETVCTQARTQAAAAPAATKRIKVGKIELERAAGDSAAAVQGDDWCARASRLRLQLAQQARQAQRGRSMTLDVEAAL